MWYDQLKTIEEGSKILEVWALNAPYSLGGELVHMADITLMTPLVTSYWADTNLYFRHVKCQKDLRHMPKEWKKALRLEGANEPLSDISPNTYYLDNDNENVPEWPMAPHNAERKYMAQIEEYGCPFAWLLDMW